MERISYITAELYRMGSRELPQENWVNLKAVELAVVAVEQNRWFMAQLRQRRLRMTDILLNTYDLDSFFSEIDQISEGRRKRFQFKRVGQKLLELSDVDGDIEPGLNGYHGRVRDFVEERSDLFGLENNTSLE